jgi:hypothetical protein
MRRALLWLSGVVGLTFLLGWWFWPPRPDIQSDLGAVEKYFDTSSSISTASRGPSGDSTGSGGTSLSGPDIELSEDDARFLHEAQQILRRIPLPPGYQSRLVDDELTRKIYEAAEKRVRGLPTGPNGGNENPATRAATEGDRLAKRTALGDRLPKDAPAELRGTVARQIEAGVHEVGERLALAQADRAL